MTIAHLSNLFPFLEEIGARPRKNLSQNFLIDENIVRKIGRAASIEKGDSVLEIGPGPGALTQELLRLGANVFAVEMDRQFAKQILRLQIDDRLQVFQEDFLKFPLSSLKTKAPLKVVANLPYHIATPILEKLCDHSSLFSSALVMMQKEMADRVVAKTGTKEMSSFTIFLKTYSDPTIALKVSRNCFYPAPNVDSSIVKLDFKKPIFSDPKPFLNWMRLAFQQRRKMLRSTLKIKGSYSTKRPEDLSFEEWIQLFNEEALKTRFGAQIR